MIFFFFVNLYYDLKNKKKLIRWIENLIDLLFKSSVWNKMNSSGFEFFFCSSIVEVY